MKSTNFVSIKEVLNDIISSIEKSEINNLNKLNIRRVERLNKRNNSILLYKIIKNNDKYILRDKNNIDYDNKNINEDNFKNFYYNIIKKNTKNNITGIYLEENDTYIRIYYKSKEVLDKGNKPYLKININHILNANISITNKTFEDLKTYIKYPKNSNIKRKNLNVKYISHNSKF